MNRRVLQDVLHLTLVLTPVLAHCQTGSLKGIVRDKFQKTPIGGAQILVDKQLVGISLGDGTYSVPVQKTGKRAVMYKQLGYLAQSYDVVVSGTTTRDAELAKDTAEASYWKIAAERIQTRALTQQNPEKTYAGAWKEIDLSSFSPEAKAAAAKQLWLVLPSSEQAPESLAAYQKTDPEMLRNTAAHFNLALTKSQTLTLDRGAVPAPVAADVAATEVVKFEAAKQGAIEPSFYTNFQSNFGDTASMRLKAEVLKLEKNNTQ